LEGPVTISRRREPQDREPHYAKLVHSWQKDWRIQQARRLIQYAPQPKPPKMLQE
jgi:hypothetical protein